MTTSTVVNCFLKENFIVDENADLEVMFNGDNDLESSFEDDDIKTNEPGFLGR